jgi:antitoxin ParD1/3/4
MSWHWLTTRATAASHKRSEILSPIRLLVFVGRVCNGGTDLAKYCQKPYAGAMSTMNISLPDTLKSFVDEQVHQRGYGTSSEYVRELIRKDQDRLQMRSLLLAGAASAPATPADANYFDDLRDRARKATRAEA